MSADVANQLQTRREEREALLERAVALLDGDERVVAAWLAGSLGRGGGDALSDIDLWVIVADGYIEEMVARRREYVAGVGRTLLIEEAPQNGPPGGGYLLVLYGGRVGPHQVDWYWQARSEASVPAGVRVLFDKVGIPPAPTRATQTVQERAEAVTNQAAYFWAMVNIIAKKVARRQSWAALQMLSSIRRSLDKVKWLLDPRPNSQPPGHSDKRTDLPPVRPAEQLALLREMAREMETLAPQLATLGRSVPTEATAEIYQLFDLVEAMIGS